MTSLRAGSDSSVRSLVAQVLEGFLGGPCPTRPPDSWGLGGPGARHRARQPGPNLKVRQASRALDARRAQQEAARVALEADDTLGSVVAYLDRIAAVSPDAGWFSEGLRHGGTLRDELANGSANGVLSWLRGRRESHGSWANDTDLAGAYGSVLSKVLEWIEAGSPASLLPGALFKSDSGADYHRRLWGGFDLGLEAAVASSELATRGSDSQALVDSEPGSAEAPSTEHVLQELGDWIYLVDGHRLDLAAGPRPPEIQRERLDSLIKAGRYGIKLEKYNAQRLREALKRRLPPEAVKSLVVPLHGRYVLNATIQRLKA